MMALKAFLLAYTLFEFLEIQKGYMLKGRLLRPSLVGVSKKATKEEKSAEKTEKKGGN